MTASTKDFIAGIKAKQAPGTGFQVVLQVACVTTEEDLNHPTWDIVWFRRGIPKEGEQPKGGSGHRLYGRKRDYPTLLQAEAAALGFIQTRQALKGAVIEIAAEDRELAKQDADQGDPLA